MDKKKPVWDTIFFVVVISILAVALIFGIISLIIKVKTERTSINTDNIEIPVRQIYKSDDIYYYSKVDNSSYLQTIGYLHTYSKTAPNKISGWVVEEKVTSEEEADNIEETNTEELVEVFSEEDLAKIIIMPNLYATKEDAIESLKYKYRSSNYGFGEMIESNYYLGGKQYETIEELIEEHFEIVLKEFTFERTEKIVCAVSEHKAISKTPLYIDSKLVGYQVNIIDGYFGVYSGNSYIATYIEYK